MQYGRISAHVLVVLLTLRPMSNECAADAAYYTFNQLPGFTNMSSTSNLLYERVGSYLSDSNQILHLSVV